MTSAELDRAPAPGATRAQALAGAARRLEAAGCDTPRVDAELLLAEALGVGRATLLTGSRERLDAGGASRFAGLVERRTRREPVAYLLGRRAFRDLELAVDERVLVPRPETELLVEAALELPPGARVLDVGTGSGAVALALVHERPDLRVTGSDLDPDALAVARANARRLGLSVAWRQANLLTGVDGPWDAVVANLPYVADRELAGLAPEVARYEPRSALRAGRDGLAPIGRLVAQAAAAGVPWLALEVGLGQAGAVGRRLAAVAYGRVEVRRDLARIPRVLVARR